MFRGPAPTGATITRRSLLAGAALAILPTCARADGASIVDSAGRKVALPPRIGRVFCAGPPACIALYTLAPELLLGWTRALRPEDRAFLVEPYAGLPTVGRLTGRGNTANLETVLGLKPDLILDYGTVNPTYVSLADRVQRQTGIPYLLLDGAFGHIAASYTLLGRAVGRRDVARAHADYVDHLVRRLDVGLAKVPARKRPRVYYGRGPAGLQTGGVGSINTEIIERVGAVNVAAPLGRAGLVDVSLEQVIGWNPDTIITVDAAFHRRAVADPLWRDVQAVRTGRVFLSPRHPFGWIDFPPAVNRLLGLHWLSRLFYPDVFTDDLRPAVRDFHRRFYHRDPTGAQLDALLAGALPHR
jgi:iron complex transport system substrate-binding protein